MKLRQYLRVQVQCPVEFSSGDFTAEGSVIDLSLGGWHITSAQPVTAGMSLSLRVFLPDAEQPLQVKMVTVQWSRDDKFGVKTILLGKDEQKRLERFIVTHVNQAHSPSKGLMR